MTSGTQSAKVHVIDDDEPVRRSIAMFLRSADIPVETYPSASAFLDALDAAGVEMPGCVLTDMRMPGVDGLGLLNRLHEKNFPGPVIVMTAHGDVTTAVRVMKAGAVDFIEKPFDDEALLAVIRTARAGIGSMAPVAADASSRLAALSPREREVLELLVAGKPNKAIARDLGLSPRTVEVHRARLMTRLGVSSLAEAVRLAVRAESEGGGTAGKIKG